MVLIKLDPEYDSIKLTNGMELYIDTSFEKEKHTTVTGEIYGLPKKLEYYGIPNKGMPWLTDMELKMGDKVIIHYLSVIIATSPENRRIVFEGNDRYIWVPYDRLFITYSEKFIKPINGYCLIEPSDDPWWLETKQRLEKIGLEAVRLKEKNNTNVIFGKVKYLSVPNREYVDEGNTDEGVDVNVGDTVILRKISDIPLQYDLHAKIDGGAKYYRVQRRNILAKA